ncbi:capsular polysaccharide biosynthesis protein [Desulfosarcina sp.]|uniref:capsular polysaccharide biosynthesis protein n=1 Tax=Desulfosarcina sp. TaxID=2027861 RepID=UPI003970919C
MLGTFSKGILKRRLLPLALEADLVACRQSSRADKLSGIIGWGLKDNTEKADAFARRHQLPYLSLEDGFVRSVGLGVRGAEPFGFIVDRQGIYYNARQPSDVEALIKAADTTDASRARRLIQRLVNLQATKYNHVWHSPALPSDDRPNILLIDQTVGDMSVRYGLADENSFQEMVHAALQRYPRGRFLVKTHPDVIAGRKKGYLTDKLPHAVGLIAEDCNPIALLQQVDHVFTVTSQMGFEALLVGRKVTCFGMPFYAGWGLTEDRVACTRRNVKRTLAQLFHAAYLDYVRYVDPISEQRCELERILDLIENHKRIVTQNRGQVYCFGFRWWKRGIIKRFLGSAEMDPVFLKNKSAPRVTSKTAASRIAVWGAGDDRHLRDLARRQRIPIERVEDGFIRSVGLGSDLNKPASLIVDRRGIYFDPRQPSDLEHLLNTVQLDDAALARAKRIRQRIVNSGISKYNTGHRGRRPAGNKVKTVILVPGQVEDDASIRTGSIDIKTNLSLLKAVRQANPDAHIIFKPHPDVLSGNRTGAVPVGVAKTMCDAIATDCDINDCLDQADQIHTMTSLTGFEALLRGKTVHTYGLPFYAGWGLTIDRHPVDRRRRRRTVDELLYCALVLYPRYYDWGARMFVSVEDAIEGLLRQKTSQGEAINMAFWRRLIRKAFNLLDNIGLLFKR